MHALKRVTNDGTLTKEQFIRAADDNDPLFDLVEIALKGPELELPNGLFFEDKGGHQRRSIRRKWWDSSVSTWREVAMSVPNPKLLPDQKLPDHVLASSYPSDAPPVFFGHYWMEGAPQLQAINALCLDYSAGKDGALVSYGAEPGKKDLSLDNLSVHR